jgi:hypothetical protein
MRTEEYVVCEVCGARTRRDSLFCRKCGTDGNPGDRSGGWTIPPVSALAGASVGASLAFAVLPGIPAWAFLAAIAGSAVLVWASTLILTLGLSESPAGARPVRFLQVDALEAVARMRVSFAVRPSLGAVVPAGEPVPAGSLTPLEAA